MSTPTPSPIAFIGLGAMGFGMAVHLLKHHRHPVTGFDVHPPTLSRFASAGGLLPPSSPTPSPASAVKDKPFVICMVATAAQAQAVLLTGPDAAIPAMAPGAVLLLCSTVPCAYVQGLQRELVERGRADVLLVDAPVSGGSVRASEGRLSIMAAGREEALETARPILDELADERKLYVVKGGMGMGSNMKMVHQVLAAVQILGAAEAMGLAAQLGLVDAEKVEREVLKSEGWSWMFGHRVPRMRTGFVPVSSAVTIIAKDAGIVTAEARRKGVCVGMTGTAEQVFLQAVGMGYGGEDDSGLVRVYDRGVGQVRLGNGEVKGMDEEKTALVVDLLKGIHLLAAAEALGFAHAVGLDLDQVFDLCVNAAGGSKMLERHGPGMIKALRAGTAREGWQAEEGEETLKMFTDGLCAVMEEAQSRKVPLYLGSQALSLLTRALRTGEEKAAAGSVVKLYVA